MKEEVKKSLKSNETDDWLDINVVRPFAYYWAVGFNKFDIHPNTVTILSMFVGAASAIFFYHGSFCYEGFYGLTMNLIGILLLCVADILDCTDGQLARLTGKTSRLGRILDGLAGFTWFLPIYWVLIFRFFNHHSIEFNLLGIEDNYTNALIATIIAGVLTHVSGFYSMASQCRLADYYIQCHLYFLKDAAGSELDNSEKQRRILSETPKEGNTLWRLFLRNYIQYTKAQEKVTPQFQNMLSKLLNKYGESVNFPSEIKQQFLGTSRNLMKYVTMLTFNFRSLIFFICCFADLPMLNMILEVFAFGIFAMWINHKHESLCKSIADKL